MRNLIKKVTSVDKKTLSWTSSVLLIRNLFFYVAMSVGLTACDNELFNELFRNPYIIEVAELDNINANQWYEFETNAKALNKSQYIEVLFKGSEAGNLDVTHVGHDENYEGGRHVFTSTAFSEDEIIFEIKGLTNDGVEYSFTGSGLANGIYFEYLDEPVLMGKTITLIRMKANLDHEDIKVMWVSRTGK